MDPLYLPLYKMKTCRTRDLCIWHYTEWLHVGLVIYVSGIIQNDVGLVICVSDIIQNDSMLDSWSSSFCIMSDTQITSPTCRHSVLCQIHRSRVQHGIILYNVRCTDHESNIILYNVRCTDHESNIILYNAWYTDHESNIASSCIMSDTQITSPTLRHHV